MASGQREGRLSDPLAQPSKSWARLPVHFMEHDFSAASVRRRREWQGRRAGRIALFLQRPGDHHAGQHLARGRGLSWGSGQFSSGMIPRSG
jgi:hypothetical protein